MQSNFYFRTFGFAFLLQLACFSNCVQANTIVDVSEIDSYIQIYGLSIQNSGLGSYYLNNSGIVISGGIDRIGYYLELQSTSVPRQWIWVSMDAFTQNLTRIGVPTNFVWQQRLSNMNVESNSPSPPISSASQAVVDVVARMKRSEIRATSYELQAIDLSAMRN